MRRRRAASVAISNAGYVPPRAKLCVFADPRAPHQRFAYVAPILASDPPNPALTAFVRSRRGKRGRERQSEISAALHAEIAERLGARANGHWTIGRKHAADGPEPIAWKNNPGKNGEQMPVSAKVIALSLKAAYLESV